MKEHMLRTTSFGIGVPVEVLASSQYDEGGRLVKVSARVKGGSSRILDHATNAICEITNASIGHGIPLTSVALSMMSKVDSIVLRGPDGKRDELETAQHQIRLISTFMFMNFLGHRYRDIPERESLAA